MCVLAVNNKISFYFSFFVLFLNLYYVAAIINIRKTRDANQKNKKPTKQTWNLKINLNNIEIENEKCQPYGWFFLFRLCLWCDKQIKSKLRCQLWNDFFLYFDLKEKRLTRERERSTKTYSKKRIGKITVIVFDWNLSKMILAE